jgi:hypothetical protein
MAGRNDPRGHQKARPHPGRRRTPGPRAAARQSQTRARNLAVDRRIDRGQVSEATPSSDSSRFVYSEILSDETKETASTFMRHAVNAFALLGVKVQRVLTDNGSCYRSRAFAEVLTEAGISHKRTRPYRPGTAPNQRQGGTLQPDPPRGGPMQGHTAQKPNAKPATRTSSSTSITPGPHRTRRRLTRQPRHQPTGLIQLVRAAGSDHLAVAAKHRS